MYWLRFPYWQLLFTYVNTIINKRSEHIQALLSDLTTNAQESYSGIRVIKSFVQENAMLGFFKKEQRGVQKKCHRPGKGGSDLFSINDFADRSQHFAYDHDRGNSSHL